MSASDEEDDEDYAEEGSEDEEGERACLSLLLSRPAVAVGWWLV